MQVLNMMTGKLTEGKGSTTIRPVFPHAAAHDACRRTAEHRGQSDVPLQLMHMLGGVKEK